VDSALERLRALPGVEAASPAWAVPLNPFLAFNGGRETSELRPDGSRGAVRVQYNVNAVGTDFFRTLAIPILQGRAFMASDRAGASEVVILNETMARRLFGKCSPIGRVIGFPDKHDARVIGVARNSKYVTLGEEDAMALYTPFSQKEPRFAHFVVRTRDVPESMLRKVDAALGQLDPAAAVETVAMRHVFDAALLPSRTGAGITGVMAVFGLILASVGLYGVLLYAVNRRVRRSAFA
jgi:ABC-type antimicrobial peptide transport system permease subunit